MNAYLRPLVIVLATSFRASRATTMLLSLELVGLLMLVIQPLALSRLISAMATHDEGRTIAYAAIVVGLASSAYGLMLAGTSARITQLERVGHVFDAEVANLIAAVPTLDGLVAPEVQNQVQLMRDSEGAFGNALNSLLNSLNNLVVGVGILVVAIATDLRLVAVAVAGLCALAVLPRSTRLQSAAEEASAAPGRLAAELLELGLSPRGAAEIRVLGLSATLRDRLHLAVARWRRPLTSAAAKVSVLEALCAIAFYATAGVVLGWMVLDVVRGRQGYGTVVAGVLLLEQLQMVGPQIQESFIGMAKTARTANRLLYLRDYVHHSSVAPAADGYPPARLEAGIELHHVSYTHPGSAQPTISDVSATFPSGSVVAIVGENGAGKSTLVNLLCGLLAPDVGRVVIDDMGLSEIRTSAWRERLSGAFQDYGRFEFIAAESIGVGDIERIADDQLLTQAVRRAGAEEMVDSLPQGLRTRLGARWADGVDLSGGQWQKVAVARSLMRQVPLLLVLDEPTASLDPEAEHALFARYVELAQRGKDLGSVTVLVTHRFSTVPFADLIIVLKDGQVAEMGSHDDLLHHAGHYAELYDLQARGYRDDIPDDSAEERR